MAKGFLSSASPSSPSILSQDQWFIASGHHCQDTTGFLAKLEFYCGLAVSCMHASITKVFSCIWVTCQNKPCFYIKMNIMYNIQKHYFVVAVPKIQPNIFKYYVIHNFDSWDARHLPLFTPHKLLQSSHQIFISLY